MPYKDPEKQRAAQAKWQREYNKRNREKVKAAKKRYYEAHPEVRKAEKERYYARYPEKLKQEWSNYRAKNRNKINARERLRKYKERYGEFHEVARLLTALRHQIKKEERR